MSKIIGYSRLLCFFCSNHSEEKDWNKKMVLIFRNVKSNSGGFLYAQNKVVCKRCFSEGFIPKGDITKRKDYEKVVGNILKNINKNKKERVKKALFNEIQGYCPLMNISSILIAMGMVDLAFEVRDKCRQNIIFLFDLYEKIISKMLDDDFVWNDLYKHILNQIASDVIKFPKFFNDKIIREKLLLLLGVLFLKIKENTFAKRLFQAIHDSALEKKNKEDLISQIYCSLHEEENTHIFSPRESLDKIYVEGRKILDKKVQSEIYYYLGYAFLKMKDSFKALDCLPNISDNSILEKLTNLILIKK